MYGWIKSKSFKKNHFITSLAHLSHSIRKFSKNFDSFEVNSAFSSRKIAKFLSIFSVIFDEFFILYTDFWSTVAGPKIVVQKRTGKVLEENLY